MRAWALPVLKYATYQQGKFSASLPADQLGCWGTLGPRDQAHERYIYVDFFLIGLRFCSLGVCTCNLTHILSLSICVWWIDVHMWVCVQLRFCAYMHYSSLCSPCCVDIGTFEVFSCVDAGASATHCHAFVILITFELWLRVRWAATNSTTDNARQCCLREWIMSPVK